MAAEWHHFKRISQSIGLVLGASGGAIWLPKAPQIMLVRSSLRFSPPVPVKDSLRGVPHQKGDLREDGLQIGAAGIGPKFLQQAATWLLPFLVREVLRG